MIEPYTNPWETEDSEFKSNYHGLVYHNGRPEDSVVQDIVNYAYRLWWYDFVAVLECENWSYDLNRLWDNWHAHWLCQMNDRYHKDIPADYTTNWVVAVEYCYQKWKWWTVFYWPSRKIKGQTCAKYVESRFNFLE